MIGELRDGIQFSGDRMPKTSLTRRNIEREMVKETYWRKILFAESAS